MPAEAILFDPQSGRWLRFHNLVEEIEVHDRDRILPTLDALEQRVEKAKIYAAGFVSYEAAAAFDEALQTRPKDDFPLLRFGLFADANPTELPPPEQPADYRSWQRTIDEATFAAQVTAIREAIARGETYQVNLTFPLETEGIAQPWSFFRQLAAAQQSCGAGFLQSERWAICSISPELFFDRDNRRLTMRPMKGTARRGRTLAEDRQQAAALLRSAKNRAENIMILDMVRNDLGRLATPGTVHTEAICSLEKYPTVWQLTSTVTARTQATLGQIFQALFPCASITGAPKPKTMAIIAALENTPRRIYTGAFGWLAPGRKAHFNVAIRTVLIDRQSGRARYGVGAGITWDSQGHEEYRECLDKAAALQQSWPDFALLETLRWSPGKGYFLLAEHLSRLASSAEYFDFPCKPENVVEFLQQRAVNFPPVPQRVRLLLHADDTLSVEHTTIPPAPARPARLRLARTPIDSRDPFLYHKTTHRALYESHLRAAGDADDIVLWNERREITECCTANLVIRRKGRFLTPPLASGLLPGTYRAFLLERGLLEEAPLLKNDLRAAESIYLINAVRTWRKVATIEGL
ncbi:MAG: aminodeoxychorismate synthase component I [Desulfuromonadales bacterium]